MFALTALAATATAQTPPTETPAEAPAAATMEAPAAVAAEAPAASAHVTAAHVENVHLVGDAKAGEAKAAVCGACHGMDGNASDKQYPKLAGQNEAYVARQLALYKSMQRQNPIMLGFAATLSAQDMHDLGAFYATKAVSPGITDDALLARGQALYRGGDAKLGVPACMACHGPAGGGMAGSGFPHLAGQWTDYVSTKLHEWKNGVTWGTDANAKVMPQIAQQMGEADIAAVSSYIEGLHAANAGTNTAAK
jgi:cytochrome c553